MKKIYSIFKLVSVILFIFLLFDIILFSLLPSKIKSDLVVSRAHRIKSFYYHHDLRPNALFKDHWGFENYLIHTNNLGFKDREKRNINFKKKNILFIGDSFTEGVGLKFDDTYVGLISKKLKIKYSDVEILNAGVQSYSPKIYYTKLFDIIKRKQYPITHVLVMISEGDIFDDYYRYGNISKENILYHEDFQNKYIIKLINFLKGNTLSYQFVAKITPPKVIPGLIKSLFIKEQKETYQENLRKLKNKDVLSMKFMNLKDLEYFYNNEAFNTWGKKGIDNSFYHIKKISDLLEEEKIKLDVMYVKGATFILKKPIQNNFEYLIKKFKKLETSNHVKFHYINEYDSDYTSSFESYKNLFFIGDVHWNKNGNKNVAEEILRKIKF